MPLYRNRVLVGGLGVSGDGVVQDDFVTAAGAAGLGFKTQTTDGLGRLIEAHEAPSISTIKMEREPVEETLSGS
ncbi:MAG TPA: hypothetical protein VK724_25100 [Bryobacteraceae bacterium]|nr:hypothetical protein [Bryobacteraceae bacterium]